MIETIPKRACVKLYWLLSISFFTLLAACQGNASFSPPGTATPLPTTTQPDSAMAATPYLTQTPSPMPPTPTPEWMIPPLPLSPGTQDVLVYLSDHANLRGENMYALALDADGQPQAERQLWWQAHEQIAGLQLSPNGRLLAVYHARASGDDGFILDPLSGADPLAGAFGYLPIWKDVSGYNQQFLGWAGDSSGILFALDGTIALFGQEHQMLLENPADYRRALGAALSPDGRYLVYSLDGGHIDGASPGTWILDLETQSTEKLLDFSIFKPVWSPDGQWIAFTDFDLMIMRPDGSDLQVIYPHSIANEGFFPVWSPDGVHLAFVAQGPAPTDGEGAFPYNTYIADVNADGVSNVRSAIPGMDYGFINPSWSPDGEYLLVTSGSAENADILLVSLDGKTIQTLTFDGGSKRHPIWLRIGE